MTRPIVVLTLSGGALGGLRLALAALSITVKEHPLLTFEPPDDWTPVDDAILRVGSFGAVALTSPRAGRAFAQRLHLSRPPGEMGEMRPQVWATGAATAATIGAALGPVRLPPAGEAAAPGAAETLARAMIAAGVRTPILFPCGDARRDDLPRLLAKAHLAVHEVCCYRSRLAEPAAARNAMRAAAVAVVGSPRVVALLVGAIPANARPSLIAVGPTTAAAAAAVGWPPAGTAERPTADAVAAAVRGLLAPC